MTYECLWERDCVLTAGLFIVVVECMQYEYAQLKWSGVLLVVASLLPGYQHLQCI